jgi:Cu+-exporting ATPase
MESKNGTQNVTFKLEGLSCGCEAKIIEKKIKGLKGIKEVNINPISNWLKVTYDSSLVAPEEMIKAISKTGIKASPIVKK